jgi:hypothetical protein
MTVIAQVKDCPKNFSQAEDEGLFTNTSGRVTCERLSVFDGFQTLEMDNDIVLPPSGEIIVVWAKAIFSLQEVGMAEKTLLASQSM